MHNNIMMKLDKKRIRIINMNDNHDDGFIQATAQKRLEMVWDITVALWAISTKGAIHAQSRLQRDVAVFKREGG